MSRLERGQVLAERYVLEAPLGEGTTSGVYRAYDQREGLRVAVKALWPELSEFDEARQRFDREARALAGIQHPHVIAVREFGLDGDMLFLVMEYLEGESLENVVDREPIHPQVALEIADQILAGLGFAHQLGVVHRDVKAGNVLLARDPSGKPRAKLLDFGLAKFADRTSWGLEQTLTASGTMLGTPGYMPPEQAFGAGVDVRCDVYSAGVVLFELLTGQLPFGGDEIPDLLRAHAVEPVPALASRRSNLMARPELQAVIERALAKRPDDRFQDANAFREALKAVPVPAAMLG